MSGYVEHGDIVMFKNPSYGNDGPFIVTNVDKTDFRHEFNWKVYLTLEHPGGGGLLSVDEDKVNVLISKKSYLKRIGL